LCERHPTADTICSAGQCTRYYAQAKNIIIIIITTIIIIIIIMSPIKP
jgi:hypothetical protein